MDSSIHSLDLAVLSRIIYELFDDLGPQLDLQRASFTCRAFRDVCQEVLFRGITVNIALQATIDKSKAFLLYLRDDVKSERIRSYIREITVQCYYTEERVESDVIDEDLQHIFRSTLLKLPHVRAVRFGGYSCYNFGPYLNSYPILPSTIHAVNSISTVDKIMLDCYLPRLNHGLKLEDISKLTSLRIWLIKEQHGTSPPETGTVVSQQVGRLLKSNRYLKHLHVCHEPRVDYLELTAPDQMNALYAHILKVDPDFRQRIVLNFPFWDATAEDEAQHAWDIIGRSVTNLESLSFEGPIAVNIGPSDPWSWHFQWETLKCLRVDNVELTRNIVERYQDRLVSVRDLKIVGSLERTQSPRFYTRTYSCDQFPLQTLAIPALKRFDIQSFPIEMVMGYLDQQSLVGLNYLRLAGLLRTLSVPGDQTSVLRKLGQGCPHLEWLELSFYGPCLIRDARLSARKDEEYKDPYELFDALTTLENLRHLFVLLNDRRSIPGKIWEISEADVVSTFSYFYKKKLGKPLNSFAAVEHRKQAFSHHDEFVVMAETPGKAALHIYKWPRRQEFDKSTRTTSIWDTNVIERLERWEEVTIIRRNPHGWPMPPV